PPPAGVYPAVAGREPAVDEAPAVGMLAHGNPPLVIGLALDGAVVTVGARDERPVSIDDREGSALGHRDLELVGGHGGGLSRGSIAAVRSPRRGPGPRPASLHRVGRLLVTR